MTSKSEKYLNSRSTVPLATANMAKQVSLERRASLEQEVNQGSFRDGTSVAGKVKEGASPLGVVTSSGSGIKKYANVISSSGTGAGYRGMAGDALRQTPEVYSPLWLTSNLNLPRDKITINAWCRAFFALNPIVMNSISLHSTYPISKLNIKCKDPKIEQYFNEMIEEIDLMNICVQLAQEYWLLGEAFVHANLGDDGKWDRLVIQNPDYMVVKKTPIASEPIIMMKPDHTLREIVFKNTPDAIEQRGLIDEHVIDCVKRGQNIPMNNFNMSYIARRISPYEIRGTGLPVSIFRQLMLFDQYRECYSEDTEVLTDNGYKNILELIEVIDSKNLLDKNVIGAIGNTQEEVLSVLKMKEDFKIACVNSNTNEIEYHKPNKMYVSKHNGEMLHFIGDKVDTLVTPNHNMWVSENKNSKWLDYTKMPASKILEKKKFWKFNSIAKYTTGNNIKFIKINNKKVPIKLYLKVLGYLVSEGCVYERFTKNENVRKNRYDAWINVCQATSSDCYEDMKECFNKFADIFDKKVNAKISLEALSFSKHKPVEMWRATIHGKHISQHFKKEIGVNNCTLSKNKHLPRWVLNLKPELLKEVLYSLVKGDGSEKDSLYNTNSKSFRYSTTSKQLANDVYELVYKTGKVPNIHVSNREFDNGRKVTEYIVLWSNTNYGDNPTISTFSKPTITNGGGAVVKKIDYDGLVWCFEVPTGLFITRRNYKTTIQGNCNFVQASNLINPMTLVKIGSAQYKPTLADIQGYRDIWEQAQYDKDFKIFTQNDVTVEKIGSGAAVMDTSAQITQLIKEMMMGLLVPSVLMDGGADTTYANGGVALDVLRQRYMQFRNMLATWLKTKIFAPISKIQEFYEYKDKKKNLIIPEIDWNYMSLFDAGDYVSAIKELAAPGEGKRVSVQTLYRSLGLEYEDEVRKMRKEDIQEAIRKKEVATLGKMPLNELRALTEDDEINEVVESPLPGEQTSEEPPAGGDAGGMGGGMDMGMGAPGGGLDLGGGGAGGLPGLDLGGGSPPGGEPPGGAPPPPPPA